MSLDDEDKKSKIMHTDEDTEGTQGTEGDSGTGGQSGQIEFKDFIGTGERLRDDLLPADEKKRLLSVHKDTHEIRVKKQKELRDQRQSLKDGKIPLQTYRQGVMGTGMNSQYKANPVLANKAQFSGIDRQVNTLPTENVADTNDALRDKLENQYRKTYVPQYAPTFNPKPQYR